MNYSQNKTYIRFPTSKAALDALSKVALARHAAHSLLIKLCTLAEKTENGYFVVYTNKPVLMEIMDCSGENIRRCMNILSEQRMIVVEQDKVHVGMMWIEVKFLNL
jgi:hypothetical protein